MLALALVFACFVGQTKGADEPATANFRRYHSLAGSRVAIGGNSGIHGWKAEGNLIAGFLEVGPGFPREILDGTQIQARAELFIPVKNLKAVGSDSEQVTTVMHRNLRAQEHPKIVFRLSGLIARVTMASTDSKHKFDSTGELTIGGVTNKISMPVTIEVLSSGALKILAKARVKQSDFNLGPRPRIDSWIDNDTVNIQCEWRVAEKSDSRTQPGRPTIEEAFGRGVSELAKEGFPLDRREYKITMEATGLGWEMRYVDLSGGMSRERLLKIQSSGSLSASAIQPGNSGIEEAFGLGIAETVKEGYPLKQGDFRVSIWPTEAGWMMQFELIPKKMSGDRLLIIRNESVQVVPLF